LLHFAWLFPLRCRFSMHTTSARFGMTSFGAVEKVVKRGYARFLG
jgi:hypothetical protein